MVTIAYNINTDKNLVCICTLIFGLVARPGSTKWRVRHPPFSYGEIDERIKFEPEGNKIKVAAITVALAFATFENVCYLIQNGTDRFSFIFFRGFGTGAMHVLCGLIVGGGKMVRFPLIAEEITEYSLLESCFLAALKFF